MSREKLTAGKLCWVPTLTGRTASTHQAQIYESDVHGTRYCVPGNPMMLVVRCHEFGFKFFDEKSDADALVEKWNADERARRDRHNQAMAERAKKSARAQADYEKLYAEAMSLCRDSDDCEYVEHQCQTGENPGHAGDRRRLREFIRAAKNRTDENDE